MQRRFLVFVRTLFVSWFTGSSTGSLDYFSQLGDGFRHVFCDEAVVQGWMLVGVYCRPSELREGGVPSARYFLVVADNPVTPDELGQDCEVVSVAAAGGVFVAVGRYDCLVVADGTTEGDETFVVNLGSATNANISDNSATGTLTPDSPSKSWSLNVVMFWL